MGPNLSNQFPKKFNTVVIMYVGSYIEALDENFQRPKVAFVN